MRRRTRASRRRSDTSPKHRSSPSTLLATRSSPRLGAGTAESCFASAPITFHGSAKLSFEEIREELEMTFECEEDAMSPTDWKLAGETPGRPGRKLFKAPNRTMPLLAERRAEVLWEARELIILARDYPVR